MSFSLKPYPHWCIKDFVKDLTLLKKLKEDLMKLKFKNKFTDLFKFSQVSKLSFRLSQSFEIFDNMAQHLSAELTKTHSFRLFFFWRFCLLKLCHHSLTFEESKYRTSPQ